MGSHPMAIKILRTLMERVPKYNKLRPRIICGIVFCSDVKSREEKEEFKKELLQVRRSEELGISIQHDIGKALALLSKLNP